MTDHPMSGDVSILRHILHRALVRYLTVRPGGFELPSGGPLRRVVEARILGYTTPSCGSGASRSSTC